MSYRCYEHIKGQSEAWKSALAAVDERVEEVRVLLGDSTEVLFTSCGSPYFLGLATAPLWREAVGLDVMVAPSSEVMLFPGATLPRGGKPLLLVASRSGETTETIRAVEAFSRRFPGRTVVIGCRSGSALDALADVSIVVPEGYEDVIPQTRSFGAMYLASQYLAALLAGDAGLAVFLRGLPDVLPPLLDRWEPEIQGIAREGWDSAVFLGGGPLYGVAVEGALKLIEMSLTRTASYHYLEVRHGPRSVIDERTLVVGLGSLRGEDQESRVLGELADDAHPHVLSLTSVGRRDRNGSVREIPVGDDVPEHALGLLYLPLLQLLAYHRAVHNGVDPDESRNLTGYVELTEG